MAEVAARKSQLDEMERRAVQLAIANKWDEQAVELNSAILTLDPQSVPALNRLAKCYKEMRQPAKALGLYQQALKINPSNRIAKNGYNDLHARALRTRQASRAKSYDEAFKLAMAARDRGNRTSEITLLQRALEFRETEVCFTALAAAYRHTGNLRIAEQLYRDLLRRRPSSKQVKVGLAAVLRDKEALDEAEGLSGSTLEEHPEDEHAEKTLAAIRADKRRQGRWS